MSDPKALLACLGMWCRRKRYLAARIVALGLFVTLAAAQSAAQAEGQRVAGLFDFLFSDPNAGQPATQEPQAGAPVRHKHKRAKRTSARERGDFPARERPARTVAAQKPPPPPATPKVAPSLFVAVAGDNLAVQLLQGLQEGFAEQPEVAFLRKAKEASGLTRDDYYDWVKASRDMLASKEHIDIGVMILGSNDAQALHEGSTTYEMKTDKWKEVYTARVDAIIRAFKDKKIPLIWVGIPIMRNERLSSHAASINEILRAETTKAGEIYVDSWQGFADDQGAYQDYGPDATGQNVKLRASDGIHFTKAGSRKLALFVEPDIRRILENSKPPVDAVTKAQEAEPQDTGLPPQPTVDINVLIQRELAAAGKPAGSDGGKSTAMLEARLPVPALPLEPVVPLKPAAGPVIPLTATPVSPNGELVSANSAAQPRLVEKAPALERALLQGLPLDAKPGRADDFRWPHP